MAERASGAAADIGEFKLQYPPAGALLINGDAIQRSTVARLAETLAFTARPTSLEITFADPTFAPSGGLLIDGLYSLTVTASKIVGAGGPVVADVTQPLHRLFGDADGDRDVDAADFAAMRLSFGSPSAAFDFDGDGDTDAADFAQFRRRFGAVI